MAGRIVLLVTSPRLPAGLLSAQAWDLVRTHPVFAGADSAQTAALRAAGAAVTLTDRPVEALLSAVSASAGGCAVWLAGPGGDQEMARELGMLLAREPGTAEIELMYGSWDPPGARLLDAVTVMDRLASPGGDPWKLQQTHESLAQFLLEEAYEAFDAITSGDRAALREELGDVLLQVLLHARMAQDLPDSEAWSIDDVAGDLVDKLIRRNPHVFGDAQARDVDEITEQWERIKKAEKARDSVLDGIAPSQPALSLATKILSRAARAGFPVELPAPEAGAGGGTGTGGLGEQLLRIVADALGRGEDAEAELRRAALALADRIRAGEHARAAGPAGGGERTGAADRIRSTER